MHIPPGELAQCWGAVGPWIERVAADSDGRFTPAAMVERIVRGDWMLLCVVSDRVKAVLAVETYQELSGLKVAAIRFTTGEHSHEWAHLIAQIEDWARMQGCARIEAWARKGWAKRLPDYRMTHILLEKDL